MEACFGVLWVCTTDPWTEWTCKKKFIKLTSPKPGKLFELQHKKYMF